MNARKILSMSGHVNHFLSYLDIYSQGCPKVSNVEPQFVLVSPPQRKLQAQKFIKDTWSHLHCTLNTTVDSHQLFESDYSLFYSLTIRGVPGGSVIKNVPANAGRREECRVPFELGEDPLEERK